MDPPQKPPVNGFFGEPVTGVPLGPPPACGAPGDAVISATVVAPPPSAPSHSAMPPPLPTASPLVADVRGTTLANVVARNVEVEGCQVRDAHFTDVYVRNCLVAGGAFQGCTFKSCQLDYVYHCYNCRFDDCTVSANCTLTQPEQLKRTNVMGRVV
jgi:hypothetical protein